MRSENNIRLGNAPLHASGGKLTASDVAYIDPVERLWHQAARQAGIPNNDDFNGPVQEGVGWFQLTVKDGERFGTGKAFLRPVLHRPNLTVRPGVVTTRIIIENGKAAGVSFLDRGQPETASAPEVILSAGSIGSAQLLLLSGIGPADELRAVHIAPLHDLPDVVKNLQDHINVPITFHTRERVGIGGMTVAELDAAMVHWNVEKTGPLTSCWVAAGSFARSTADVKEPDLQLYGVVFGHRDHARYLASGPGMTLQRPRSRGELRLRSADPLEHPSLDPRYFSSDCTNQDLATLAAGVQLNRRIAACSLLAEQLGREITPSTEARSDEEIIQFIRGHCTTLYHPAATCRMGTEQMAVVDPCLRVRRLNGLVVADTSVMPTIVSGNTNAPTIMIAERAAGLIAAGRSAEAMLAVPGTPHE